MSKRNFGKAEYRAIRTGELVLLIANGSIPDFNTKTDFEQLPYRITPPQFGFFFISPDFTIPKNPGIKPVPFTCKESFLFPRNANVVVVIDQDGSHSIEIEDIPKSDERFAMPSDGDSGYCVFGEITTDRLLTAKCDSRLIGPPAKVFGPATYGECMKYIADAGR